MKTPFPTTLRAVFLGTADGHTSALREHSGILLESQEGVLLLDCGANASQFLLKNRYAEDAPQAIWLSHMHSDHNGQVTSLIQSLWLRQRRATLHFYGPAAVMHAMKGWLERCLLFPELIGFHIEWHAVHPGQPTTCGPFTLTAFPTEHLTGLATRFQSGYPDTCFDCYGVMIEYAGRRYVYSADLAHPRELVPALQAGPTTALFCELSHFPERDLFREIASHLVESIWVTHYPDSPPGWLENLIAIAREEKFTGKVYLMQDKVAEEI